METPPPEQPSLESLAHRGAWRAILGRVGATGGGGASASASVSAASSIAAAWRVLALAKLRNFSSAENELERLDLDSPTSQEKEVPFALRWCAADLPARVGRPADGAAAFSRLVAFCDRRAAATAATAAASKGEGEEGAKRTRNLWRERAEAACWAAAGIHARGDDPCASRAWARAALDRRAARRSKSSSSSPSSSSSSSSSSLSWEPPLAAGAEALSAAARLELASGEPSEARRLFVVAAAARAKAEAAGGGSDGGGNEAARAAALLRLSAGDASRAASGFAGIQNPIPTDRNNEALCLLLAGDVSRARAVALESLLLLPPATSLTSSTSTASPLLFSGAALRTAAALADLAPPAATRAARDALFDAVQAAGAPEDLDASFLAAA